MRAVLLLALLPVLAGAQAPSGTVSGGWEMPLVDEGRLHTILSGEGAQMQEDGRQRITRVVVRILDESVPPGPRLVIESPECFLDMESRNISSAGSITFREVIGNYSLEGRGFLWDHSRSTLHISNDVRTVFVRARPGKESLPVRVRSDLFRYHGPSGTGTYQGRVHARQGEAFALDCTELSVLPEEGDDGMKRTLEATGGVRIRFGPQGREVTLEAESARYHDRGGTPALLTLRGAPRWETKDHSGGGEAIDIAGLDDTPEVAVRGNARMTLPMPGREDEVLHLHSESYTLKASRVLFPGRVEARTREGDRTLASRRLEVVLDETRRGITRFLAEGGVEIERRRGDETLRITGDRVRMVPGERHDILVEGESRASLGERTLQADRIGIALVGEEDHSVLAEGRVRVRLSLVIPRGVPLPGLTPAGEAPEGRISELRITSEAALMEPERISFAGDVRLAGDGGTLHCRTLDLATASRALESMEARDSVRVIRPEGELRCRRLLARFSGTESRPESIEARGDVAIRSGKGTLRGERALWRSGVENIELSGGAELVMQLPRSGDGGRVRTTAGSLLWNPSTGTFRALGGYRSQSLGPHVR